MQILKFFSKNIKYLKDFKFKDIKYLKEYLKVLD